MVLGLGRQRLNAVVSDPLVAVKDVIGFLYLVVFHRPPVTVFETLADFVIRHESVHSGKLALHSRSGGWRADAGLERVSAEQETGRLHILESMALTPSMRQAKLQNAIIHLSDFIKVESSVLLYEMMIK